MKLSGRFHATRRQYLTAVGAGTLTPALAGCSSAGGDDDQQTGSGTSDEDSDDNRPNGSVDNVEELGDHHMVIGPDGDKRFEPSRIEVDPGESVVFEWATDGHTLTPDFQPDSSNWEGVPDAGTVGDTHVHTFIADGMYVVASDPYFDDGMYARIDVGNWEDWEEDYETVHDLTIEVGRDGLPEFSPAEAAVEVGALVRFDWWDDGHTVTPVSTPADGDWDGEPSVESMGHFHEHTFDVPGTYEYVCTEHEADGMQGTIHVRP